MVFSNSVPPWDRPARFQVALSVVEFVAFTKVVELKIRLSERIRIVNTAKFLLLDTGITQKKNGGHYGFLLLVCPIETINPPHNNKAIPTTTIAQDRTVVYGAGLGDVNGLYGVAV